MFQETLKGASREVQVYLKEVQWVFQGSFKDILRKFLGCLKNVLSVFQKNFKQSFMGVSRMFCNFVIAWISSKLPEQKKGLFT